MNLLSIRRPAFLALLLATSALLCDPASALAGDNDRYAAIAYSSWTGRYGYSYNCATLERAKARALAECGTADARIVCWCKNGYIAIARGYGTATGWAYASDEATARRLALSQCLRRSSYARIVVAVPAGR